MTDTETTAPTTPFWRFSLHLYGQAGVADACIALQDGCGVDVNLLLFLFWLAADRRLLSADEVKELDDKVRDWRNLTIIPIRDVRRKLKGAPTLVEAAKQEALRTGIKEIELNAERLQQDALYAYTHLHPPGTDSAPSIAARANVAAYERVLGRSFPADAVALLIGAFDVVPHRDFARAAP